MFSMCLEFTSSAMPHHHPLITYLSLSLSLKLTNNQPITQLTTNNRGGQFRRTGVTGGNIVVGVVLGILSGKYIFEEPMQRYWAEKHAADAAAAGAISPSSNDGK